MSIPSAEPLTGEHFLTLLHGMGEAVLALSPDGQVRLWNPAAEKLFGIAASALTLDALVGFLGAEVWGSLCRGEAPLGEVTLRRKDLRPFPGRLEVTALRDPSGALEVALCVVRDLTGPNLLKARAQRQAAIAELAQGLLAGGPLEWILNEACQHLLEAAQAAQVGIWRQGSGSGSGPGSDSDAFALVAGAGWDPGTVGQVSAGTTDGAHLLVAVQDGRPAVLERLLEQRRFPLPPLLAQHEVRCGVAATIGRGRKVWGALAIYGAQPFCDVDVELVEAAANLLAVAVERSAAEQALRERESRMRVLMDQVPDGIAVWDASRRLILANSAALRMLGIPDARDVEGLLVDEVLAPEVLGSALDRVAQCIEKREALPPHDYRFADGRCIEATSVPFELGGQWAAVTVTRDVTDRRRLESQVMAADRLASVGLLAAGVAHELNNPLAWVVSNLRFIDEELSSFPAEKSVELQEALADAVQGAERMAVIVRDLKTFARTDDQTQEPISLPRVVESALKIAGPQVRHRAKLQCTSDAVPRVQGNEARMAQVLVNLLLNAAQAIPEGAQDAHAVEVQLRTGEDGFAELTVRDTGCGIPPSQHARIFEPFFTTKPVGEGTGLGLTVCHGIVTRMGGTISVESEPGQGTLFRLRFPPAAAPTAGARGVEASSASRRGRVLVVDDEAPICTAFQRILGAQHEVHLRESAESALALIDAGETFDVIFCDVMMPGLGGPGFRNEIEKRHPALRDRVIYMTGGAYTPAGRALIDEAGDGQLEKPFEPAKVRALVNAKVAAA